jgi:hypothetical protein
MPGCSVDRRPKQIQASSALGTRRAWASALAVPDEMRAVALGSSRGCGNDPARKGGTWQPRDAAAPCRV